MQGPRSRFSFSVGVVFRRVMMVGVRVPTYNERERERDDIPHQRPHRPRGALKSLKFSTDLRSAALSTVASRGTSGCLQTIAEDLIRTIQLLGEKFGLFASPRSQSYFSHDRTAVQLT